MEDKNITIQVTNTLSRKEAAQELGITTMTLYRWQKEGKITAIKLGNSLLIPLSEVERLKED